MVSATINEHCIFAKWEPAVDHWIFITAFPGPPALPIPDFRMSPELNEACQTFWDEHVFLRLHTAETPGKLA